MKVCIIGNKGNMGRRYAACLDYLNIDHWGYDGAPPESFVSKLDDTTHVIIATPTETHVSIFKMIQVLSDKLPILCEKPITKDLKELESINLDNLYMVNNYQYIANSIEYRNETVSYDYYHSGNDGIAWDCIQLFAFGNDIKLSNKSPKWQCSINGTPLSKDLIDQSYIDMLKDFTGPMKHVWDKNTIIDLHLKVAKYEIENSHRHTSSDD
jgi:hypothetical protein